MSEFDHDTPSRMLSLAALAYAKTLGPHHYSSLCVPRHSDDESDDGGGYSEVTPAVTSTADDSDGSLDVHAVAMLASFDGEEHKHMTR